MNQSNHSHLNIRDIALRDKFTSSEKLNFSALFIVFLILSWSINNQSIWISCVILLIGIASIATIKIHEIVHPFIIDQLWLNYFGYNLPAIALLSFYFLKTFGNGFELLHLEERAYIFFNTPIHLLNSNIHPAEHALFFTASVLLFSLTIQLLIIPKSLYFLNKLLSWCSISVAFTALLGYLFKAAHLTQIPLASNTQQDDFFAFFSNDAHWASFALVWMFVSFSIALVEHEKNNQRFSKSSTPLYLSISFILASTVIVIEASVASFLLALSFSYLCLKYTNYIKFEKEAIFKKLRFYIIALGLSSLIYSLYIFIQINTFSPRLHYLKSSALNMFRDNPILGWGMHSFEQLAPFYNNPKTPHDIEAIAPTASLSFLVEYGWIGIGIIISTTTYFFCKYIRSEKPNPFSDQLFLALFTTILIGFFENPFYNRTFSFSFLLIAFAAIRWSKLIYKRVDEVDTKIKLIVSDELRNVPFVTNPKKEVFK